MKKILYLIILFLINFSVFAQKGKIKVEISNIKKEVGVIYIGIYNIAETFPKADVVFEKEIKAQSSTVNYTFTNIPVGNYAVAVYHDEDEDGKIDRYFFGMPSEHYGFSRNPSVFGLPDYKLCSFKLEEKKIVTIKIKLK